jgi:hypothetical protein
VSNTLGPCLAACPQPTDVAREPQRCVNRMDLAAGVRTARLAKPVSGLREIPWRAGSASRTPRGSVQLARRFQLMLFWSTSRSSGRRRANRSRDPALSENDGGLVPISGCASSTLTGTSQRGRLVS